jgi:DNA-directed RNA polymerase subunit RPC12/RpoP
MWYCEDCGETCNEPVPDLSDETGEMEDYCPYCGSEYIQFNEEENDEI